MSKGVLLSLAPDPGRLRDEALERAVSVLRQGGVVSFATDTFYALGADPLNGTAVDRVFSIKRRRRQEPLPVLVGGFDQAQALLGGALPRQVIPLLEACWPGPLTLVLPARRSLPGGVRGPDGMVGIRWPDWPAAEALLQRFGGAVTGSSANRSGSCGMDSGTGVAELMETEVDLVLDSGPSPGGPGSTVVRLARKDGGERLCLIREGRIPLERLRALSGLAVDPPDSDSRR